MTEVVVTNRIPSHESFKASIAGYLRESVAQTNKRSDGPNARRHAGLLELTAALVESLDQDDHALGMLFDAQVNGTRPPGAGKADFHPGNRAEQIIGSAGFTPADPSPPELLAEIVRASQADLIRSKNEQAKRAVQDAELRLRQAIEPKAERTILAAQTAKTRAEKKVAGLEAENAELRLENSHLRPFAPDDGKPDPPAKSKSTAKPRQQKRKAASRKPRNPSGNLTPDEIGVL